MGISIGFSDDDSSVIRNHGTPSPYRFKIINAEKSNDFWLLNVLYPDCINYNGLKILIIEYDKDIFQIEELDPHFLENNHIKIIARFEPTEKGWKNGVKFLKLLDQDHD